MISPIGSYQYIVDAYLADFNGKATLPMIGGFMLQAATRHAEERGFGYSSMVSKNRVWVLSRMVIEIYEYPSNDTMMTIKTWVSDVNKLFTERCFSFLNAEGQSIGFARSIWASIDLETRKITNVLELDGLENYIDKEEPCDIKGMKKVPPSKDALPVNSFVVKYSDIDINKHLNSMKYIEHFVDLFDIEMYRRSEIRRFEINYVAEGRYGSKIDLLKKEESQGVFVLEMKHNDVIVSSSRVTWK